MELARGTLAEQPWGLTLGRLAQRAATGELTIVDGPLRIMLAFEGGRLIAATSTMRAASMLERAARTFELTRGTYAISDLLTLRPERGGAIELRAVVFAGARKYLTDDRLTMELRELGTRFALAASGEDDIARYGLEASARIVEALRDGVTMNELESRYHDIDGRELRAAVYALVCCGTARGLLPARAPTSPGAGRTPTPPGSRTITPNVDRTPTRPDRPRAQTPVPAPSRTITPDSASRSDKTPVPLARIPTVNVARSKTPPDKARTSTAEGPASPPPRAITHEEPADPTPATLGRTPTRVTPAGGVPIAGIAGPSADGPRAEASAAADRARRHLTANEPEKAAAETAIAIRLAPDSFDHQALHAWATFLSARDRQTAAEPARKVLEKASHRAAEPNEARFLLGRLERMVGREREALRHFRAVVERDPKHAAAAEALRELEAELEAFARR